jgi:predicted HTH domain antitoxin
MEQLVPKVLQVPLDLKEELDQQVPLVYLEETVVLEVQDQQDIQVHQGEMEAQDHKEPLVIQAFQEEMALLGPLAVLDQLVILATLVFLEPRVEMVLQELPVSLEEMVEMAEVEPQDQLVPVVFLV